jgi:hypothetical protein
VAGVQAQLKTLWVEHVREQLLEDDGAQSDSGAEEGRLESSGSVRNWAPTQQDSPRAEGGAA